MATLLHTLVALLIIVTVVKSEFLVDLCDTKNSYATNSTYQANLRQLQSSLLTSIIPSGFSNYTVDNNSEQVFGLTLCRGDVSAEHCQSCLKSIINEVSTRCPNGKQEMIWFDQCFLQYSSNKFFSTFGQVMFGFCNLNDVANAPLYKTILKHLMNTLVTQAIKNSNQMFAAGFINDASSSNKIYGLVQCTQDLSEDDCYQCLQKFVKRIPGYCYGKVGGRLLLETVIPKSPTRIAQTRTTSTRSTRERRCARRMEREKSIRARHAREGRSS